MTPQEAKRLRVGTPVKWESSGELGTVTETGEAGIRVTWKDGTVATYLFAAIGHGLLHVQRVVAK